MQFACEGYIKDKQQRVSFSISIIKYITIVLEIFYLHICELMKTTSIEGTR